MPWTLSVQHLSGGIGINVPTHLRFSIRGDFLGTAEIWSYGFHYARTVSASPDAGLDDINEAGVSSALAAFHGSNQVAAGCRLTEWRAYVIGTNGRMEGNGPLIHLFTPPVNGTGPAQKYPSQVAQVVTTVAVDRGPAKLGRFYLPAPTTPMGSDWRVPSVDAQFTITQVTAMLKGISDAIDLPGTIESSAMVNVSGLPAGTGTIQNVEHIEVGRVYDTLRTRRNALDEAREKAGVIDW